MPFPGRQTRVVVRISKGSLLIVLVLLITLAGLPIWSALAASEGKTSQGTASTTPGKFTTQLPRTVGADPVPDLSLPKTVLSSVDSLIGAGGVIQTSPDNITLYNLAVRMRLLGGQVPHDELLAPDKSVISSWSFWGIEALTAGTWLPLVPTSNSFTTLGTNTSGTFVIRDMEVGALASGGVSSGHLRVLYRATSSGPLKWTLTFTPFARGQYNLVFTWHNITEVTALDAIADRFGVSYKSGNYTFSWADLSSASNVVTATPLVFPGSFLFSIGLGTVSAGSKVVVDPSILGTYVAQGATAFTFQRKVFYASGHYWAFYFDGSYDVYRSSSDGNTWSAAQSLPSGLNACACFAHGEVYLPSIFNSGTYVVVALGNQTSFSQSSPYTATEQVPYVLGTISGSSIAWGAVQKIVESRTCDNGSPGTTCALTFVVRYVDVTATTSGQIVLSYNIYDSAPGTGLCSGIESAVVVLILGKGRLVASCNAGSSDPEESVVVQSSFSGQVRVVYQVRVGSAPAQLRSRWFDGTNSGPTDIVESNVLATYEFSAVSDASYGVHVLYRGGTNGNVTYAYLAPTTGSTWNPSTNIFSSPMGYPSLTIDYSTNDVYAIAINGTSLVMRSRSLAQRWSDQTVAFPVTNRNNPTNLGSNLASISAGSSRNVMVVWTEGTLPYTAMFASIPIQTVWSPYSSPHDPWDGNGLAPYGQYFSNLGEYVSPSTGMLTVRQTDFNVPGRGLNLELTRVYVEPYSFLNGVQYNYESNPWAPIGNGWQFNFPWMNNVTIPLYIHLTDGQGYRIPSTFWMGFSATFENHQGQSFRLVRALNGNITLYDSSGTAYQFDNTIGHKLSTITDATGNNTITFNYSNNVISCIVDTVGRAFTFSFFGGLLQTIRQVTGTCANPGTIVRSVIYTNNGQSLTSMTDAVGRVTYYSYNATSSPTVAPWLLARIRYPTSSYTNYTYTPVIVGTQAYTYRVKLQFTGTSNSPVRQFAYSYATGGGDQVVNSTVTTYDATQIVSYTKYAFSFQGMTKNVTDRSYNLISGVQQIFAVNGQIPKEIIIVTDGQGRAGSYTNYYNYDLWGNRIYSRRAINSTNLYHESFNAYYNNGQPPGFKAFQETFSQGQGTATDNSWKVYNGTWLVKDGVYNGTAVSYQDPGWSYFASADLNKTDVSVQASVYASRQIASSDQRFGIFVHYPGSGIYKWALVLRNRPDGSGNFLELLDEAVSYLSNGGPPYGQPSAKVSCTITTGIWYAFNMTVRGYGVTGTVSTPGRQPCNVSGNFPTSSPAASGTGFGLYAGGYSVLFDDVQVATVSPLITGTGFSNSFIQNGAPGPTGLNTWMATTKPPTAGWNTTVNWLPATRWSQAYAVQNYGGSPWNSNVNGWTDNNAQWIWWSANANYSASADPVWFRRVFTVSTTTTLSIQVTADNSFVLYVDGVRCAIQTDQVWQTPRSCITQTLQAGAYHVLAANATNPDGQSPTQTNPDPAGFLLTASANGQFLFHTDGVAGRNIVALAGSTQLMNGTATLPEETYYSYYPWGGLNQTKSRYDPLSVDGSTIAFCPNTTSSCSATLSTSHASDIIIVFADETLDLQISCTFSVSDTAGLSWTARTGIVYGRFGRDQLQEFWAKSAGVLSSDTITESISGCGTNYNGFQAFAISGANFSSPFDSSTGVPGFASNWSAGTSVTISTSNPNDIIFAAVMHGSPPVPSPQSGFAVVTSAASFATEYQVVGGTLTNFAVTFGDATADYWEEITDAVQPAGATQWGTPPATQWLTSTRTYDGYGNPKTYTDPRGATTYYAFSANYTYAYLTNQTRLDGSTGITTLYAYNFTTGNLRIVTDPKGNATSSQNDNLGRVTRILYPLGTYINYTYNDQYNYVDIVNENQWKTRQIYDGLARQAFNDRFLGGSSYSNETFTYNWQNKVVTRTDQLGNVYSTQYDVLGRITNSTTPNGKSVLTTYNDLKSWVRSRDQDGNYKCNVYDRLGRLVSVVEKASADCLTGTVTNYYYDETGNLLKATNALSKSTLFSYDNLGGLARTTYPDNTSGTYTFDSNRNLTNSTDLNVIKTMRSYDSLNRVKTITYCGTPLTSTSYAYDKNSNVLTIQNQNATITYSFDARNRPLNEKYEVNLAGRQIVDLGCSGSGGTSTASGGTSKTYSVSYSYNGEVLDTITYPTVTSTNIAVKFAYDGLGRVLNVAKSGTTTYYAQSFTYYQNDRLKGLQFGNSLIGNYTYDNLARPSSITLKDGATARLSLNYAYNNTGTVASVTGQVNGVTVNEQYKYDGLQRLTNATVTSQGTTTNLWYEYDSVGNRMRQSQNGAITSYTYNTANNQLTGSSTTGNSIAYSYDPNGNLKTQNVTTTATASWAYNFDAAGHLLKVTNNGANQGVYAYDGKGRLVESKEGSYNVFFSYLGTETLFKTIQGSTSTDYLYAAGLRIARVAESDGGFSIVRYYHVDPLGSTRLVTDSAKSVIFSDSYRPFGQDNGTPIDSSPIHPEHRFTGKPVSDTTGLYYYYHRWYDPSIGRFISPDPRHGRLSSPQSLNPYVYASNQPTILADPSGEQVVLGPSPIRPAGDPVPTPTPVPPTPSGPTYPGRIPPGAVDLWATILKLRAAEPPQLPIPGTPEYKVYTCYYGGCRSAAQVQGTSSGSGTLLDSLFTLLDALPPCAQVLVGGFLVAAAPFEAYAILAAFGVFAPETGGLSVLAGIIAAGDELTFQPIIGALLIARGVARGGCPDPPKGPTHDIGNHRG